MPRVRSGRSRAGQSGLEPPSREEWVSSRVSIAATLAAGVLLWVSLTLVWGPAPPESRIGLTPTASAEEPDSATRFQRYEQ